MWRRPRACSPNPTYFVRRKRRKCVDAFRISRLSISNRSNIKFVVWKILEFRCWHNGIKGLFRSAWAFAAYTKLPDERLRVFSRYAECTDCGAIAEDRRNCFVRKLV